MSSFRGRMLHGSISNSAKLAAMSCDGARLLFTWLIPHCDPMGRMRAEALQLKADVLPRHPSTLAQIERWIQEAHDLGLVTLYTNQGQRFLEVANWSRYQKFSGNMRRSSDLPERTYSVRTTYVRRTDNVQLEGEVEGEGEGEREGELEAAPKSAPKVVRGKRSPDQIDDSAIADLQAEFPDVDVAECAANYLNHAVSSKHKDKRLGLRNWIKRELSWKAENPKKHPQSDPYSDRFFAKEPAE